MNSLNTIGSNAWYLKFDGSDFGPLSLDEVHVIVASGKLSGQLFAWKEGFVDWMPIESVVELSDLEKRPAPSNGPGKVKSAERRGKRRKRLLALVEFDSMLQPWVDIKTYTGACHDINGGGMLILSSYNLGYSGSRLHLLVTPLQGAPISPFEAEAQVTHVLPKEKGFGVRFIALPERAFREIELYQAADFTREVRRHQSRGTPAPRT